MVNNMYIDGFVTKAYHTELADTKIDEQIFGRDNRRLALIGYSYVAGATEHALSLMYAGGTRTKASAAAAKDQADLVCVDAPKDPAGNVAADGDIIAYKLENGTWEFNIVDSLDTKTITCKANLSAIVPKDSPIRVYGVVGDGALFKFVLAANTATENYGSLYAVNPFSDDPFYVSIDNATNAGELHGLLFAYIDK